MNSNRNDNYAHERIEFIHSQEKKSSNKKAGIIIGILILLLVLAAVAGFLVWLFVVKDDRPAKLRTPSTQVFSGHVKMAQVDYDQKLEDTDSEEFKEFAEQLQNVLKELYQKDPILEKYYTESVVTAFSEGVIAYYWSRFDIPASDLEMVPEFSEERILDALDSGTQEQRTMTPQRVIKITEISASLTDSRMARKPTAEDCFFRLEAEEAEKTFQSPGYPDGYQAGSRCQWQIRASEENTITVSFPDFNIEDDCSDDFVSIYDSLSPDDSQAITEQCGQRPPSNPLQVVSSGNIMLINFITDTEVQKPGFNASYRTIPKATVTCGGELTGNEGNFTSPLFPKFYPPATDCKWTMKAPAGNNIRLTFSMFRMKEPGVDTRKCHKDYLEINGKKYCGEAGSLSFTSESNTLDVMFHSDESFTDKGFVAAYQVYDPKDPCPGEFACSFGACKAKKLQCDGWNDCGDMSDETQCTCREDQFKCANGMCKPKLWVCDTVDDCGDRSDEAGCGCESDQWQCSNGVCLPQDVICNGKIDCEDGSDETSCKKSEVVCSQFTFKCSNGACVNKVNAECDHVSDCSDESDESSCNCGTRPFKHNRIVGGQNAELGEWPWQVSLHFSTYGPVCGASIISESWLLSAAHCFETGDPANKKESNWRTYSGLQEQYKLDDVQLRTVKRIITHPSYNRMTYDYDIALLELTEPLQYTSKIQPVCLPASSHVFPAGMPCTVTGWGLLREQGMQARILQKATVRMINDTVCDTVTQSAVTSRMLCSGFLSGGVDACQGDSGGPLVCFEETGKWFQAGIVSWGEGCARRNKPGVYTRVTALRGWIKEQTGV